MKPATSRLLMTSLFTFCQEAIKNYQFPNPSGTMRDCRVFLHNLPEEQDSEAYPFVLVRWMEGQTTSEADARSICEDTVALVLGVNSPASQGEAGLLCAELIDCLRYALWRKRIIASRFELVEPLKVTAIGLERKIHNFHMATIETVWNYVWPAKAQAEFTEDMFL